ncbi:MAG: tyrosine-type recombinase/integrase [Acidimicrobiales bacterium]
MDRDWLRVHDRHRHAAASRQRVEAFRGARPHPRGRYLTLHGLRHTHATHLLAMGKNPRMVSERLGHADVAFTLQVYGHVLPGHQREAAETAAGLVDTE